MCTLTSFTHLSTPRKGLNTSIPLIIFLCFASWNRFLHSYTNPFIPKIAPNLVPRSHSVTGNVRSGKVRQYTISYWLLKKGCGNVIYTPIGLFRGALSEDLVFASSCAVVRRKVLFFSDPGKALQLRKIILKVCDICVNGTDKSPTYPATRIKFCVACHAVRRN